MRRRKWWFLGLTLALLAASVGCGTGPNSAPPAEEPVAASIPQKSEFDEPPETAKTRPLSEQRLAFERAMETETPHHGIGTSTPYYFEVGKADTRFIIWDASEGTGKPHKDTALICQTFDGVAGRTLFKQPLNILGTGKASVPHLGTLARIIFREGFEIAQPCPPQVSAFLDKEVALAGYSPGLPGSILRAWTISGPTGVATGVETFGLATSGGTSWMWYPISRAERRLLGW